MFTMCARMHHFHNHLLQIPRDITPYLYKAATSFSVTATKSWPTGDHYIVNVVNSQLLL